jgi:tetratricopeptide (TPR) repeat protein
MIAEDRLTAALTQQREGKEAEAEAIYREILGQDPDHAESLHCLGLMLHQSGRTEEGLALLRRSIQVKPDAADYHRNLGAAHERDGAFGEAEAAYRRATELRAEGYSSRSGLARVLQTQGKLEHAEVEYRRATELRPEAYWPHRSLAGVLRKLGKLEAAEVEFRHAADLWPDNYWAHLNLAEVLGQLGRRAAAESALERVLGLEPDHLDAHLRLARVLRGNWTRLDEAEFHIRRAIELGPADPRARRDLGALRRQQGRLAKAADAFQRANELEPDDPGTLHDLGAVLQDLGRQEDALGALDQAIKLKPDYASAHVRKAFVLLSRGHYPEGWRELEWRLKSVRSTRYGSDTSLTRSSAQSLEDGPDLEGRTVLLRSERGLSNTLQFVRYAELIRQRGGRCRLRCQKALQPLLSSYQALDQVVTHEEPPPPFDLHVPLLSLPRIFGTDLDTIPRPEGYLQAERQSDVQRSDRPAIGIACHGNPRTGEESRRGLALAHFNGLLRHQAFDFVSLQPGKVGERLKPVKWARGQRPPAPDPGPLTDVGAEVVNIAAVIARLDLVITTDSFVAHLAGALGQPVWTLLPAAPDWRWMTDREDSPWYASMRLFRQRTRDDWTDVLRDVERALLAKEEWDRAV